MKKLVCVLLVVILALAAGCGKGGKRRAEIEIENYGTIKVELDAKSADHRQKLREACRGRLLRRADFHRIIEGFMIRAATRWATAWAARIKYQGRV